MNIPSIFWLVPAASVVALGFAYAFYRKMKRQSEGTERMREIAGHVRAGAMAYLRQQYKVVTGRRAGVVAWRFFRLTGGFFSGLAGFFGMKTATARRRAERRGFPSLSGAAVSIPRRPTWVPTWWVRWKRGSRRTTRAIPRPSPTTWATTWATWPAWAPTCTRAYCGSVLATAALGAAAFATANPAMQTKAVLAPMIIAAVGIFLSIFGIFLVRTKEGATMRQLLRALGVGVNVSSVLIAADLRHPVAAGH